jgi:hypothetical protein
MWQKNYRIQKNNCNNESNTTQDYLDAENLVGKIYNKTINRLGINGNCLKIVTDVPEKLTSGILNGGKSKSFPLKSVKKQGWIHLLL